MSVLAEVFSIRAFSKHGSVNSDEVYGSIVVNDYWGGVVLFKRTGDPLEDDDDYILPDGSLCLRSDRCTEGVGGWAIRLKLYHNKGGNYLEICNGYLSISPSEQWSFFGKPMTGIVHGREGHVVVNMVMFEYAVQAKVEVKVVSSSADDVDISLYGHIHARNDFFDKPVNIDEVKYQKTTLLSASKDKPVYTNGIQKIPLSRCMTCAPRCGELIIEASLFDKLTNKVMAAGNASFEARQSGCQTERIGCIQVTITWSLPEE